MVRSPRLPLTVTKLNRFLLPIFLASTLAIARAEESAVPVNPEIPLPASIPGAGPTSSELEILVSVADQQLALVSGGEVVKKYIISTSRYGVGDSYNSYRTPLGKLRVCSKLGGGLPEGSVFKHRQPTGEILPINAAGRDPIVTRILWLEGTEGQNANARERGIYIHGTPVEKQLGRPVSYGCIRMRSRDVVDLYTSVPIGVTVTITTDHLPGKKSSPFDGPLALLASLSGKQPTIR